MIQIENKHKIEDYRFDNYIYNKNDNETLFFLKSHDYDYDTIENNGQHYRIYISWGKKNQPSLEVDMYFHRKLYIFNLKVFKSIS